LIGPGIVNFDLSVARRFAWMNCADSNFGGDVQPAEPSEFFRPSGLTAFTGVDAKGNGIIAPNWGSSRPQ